MISDYKPIIFNTPKENDYIKLYLLHDIHYGAELHDGKKWAAVKRRILDDPYSYCIFIGDAMENATPNSKSDIFYQTIAPHEQKMWFRDQLIDFKPRTIAVVDGNHERNRSTKTCGLFPLYDACVMAGIEDAYRPHFALVDIGVGTRAKEKKQQTRYFGYVVHRAANQVKFHSADMIDGIDFFVYGHDHNPADRPRGKLVYDSTRKELRQKDVEVINCGAYMAYGGYGADAGHRVTAQKMYTLTMYGKEKAIESQGFRA